MKERISEWLDSGRHFLVGRALYNAYGQDAELKALFDQGQSRWAADKLAEALGELASGTTAKLLHDEYSDMPAADDTILNSMTAQWKPVYASMNYKRHELDKYAGDDASSNATRRKLAFEILDLEQQCMAIWASREHYMEHGTMPVPKEIKKQRPADPLALGRYVEALKKRIRRNKQNLAKEPEKTIYAEYILRDEKELEEIVNGTH